MNDEKLPHRKRVKHFDEPGHFHELTFSCFQRRPLLTNHEWRCLLSESIDRAMARHGYQLSAFVFMPEHVHLIVLPGGDASKIDLLLSAIKRPYSFRIKRLLEQQKSSLLKTLDVQQRRG
jgi:putative transposase